MAALGASRIVIDGSTLEGGGQILRNSISLAALLHKPLDVLKIRNGRKPPGLKNQHRTGLTLAGEIAGAHLTGAKNGSTSISFSPDSDWQRKNLPGSFSADPKTAGSVMLLLQISLPLLLFSSERGEVTEGSTLNLRGGTNASHAPQLDYTTNLFLPFIRQHLNAPQIDVSVKKRGYYPKGGGNVSFNVQNPLPRGTSLSSFSLLEQGQVVSIGGIVHFAGLPNIVGSEIIKGALSVLKAAGFRDTTAPRPTDDLGIESEPDAEGTVSIPISLSCTRYSPAEAPGAGGGIVLYAKLSNGGVIGGSALGSKGVPNVEVGRTAAEELIRNLQNGGVLDEWLQDQVIILMALAKGRSEVNIGRANPTLHTQSAIWVAEQFTAAKFSSSKDERENIILSCDGIAYNSELDV